MDLESLAVPEQAGLEYSVERRSEPGLKNWRPARKAESILGMLQHWQQRVASGLEWCLGQGLVGTIEPEQY